MSVLAAAGVAISTQAQQISVVATGLDAPRGMTFGPDGALYISDFGAAPAGLGRILRVTIQD